MSPTIDSDKYDCGGSGGGGGGANAGLGCQLQRTHRRMQIGRGWKTGVELGKSEDERDWRGDSGVSGAGKSGRQGGEPVPERTCVLGAAGFPVEGKAWL